MSKLNRLIQWVTQPQGIAHPNPSFHTLRSLIHVQPNGKVIDVVKPSRAMTYGANIVTGIYSKGLYVSNQSDGVSEIQATGACQYQTFSRIAIVRRNFDPGATATISDSATTTATGGAQWGIFAGELLLNVTNTVQIGASSGAGFTTGVEHVVGVTYDGSTVKFFIDGRAVGSTLNARTFTIESTATLFSRGGASSPNEDLNGAIGLHADFEGALPESMMRFLTSGSNVFQLYAPRKRQIYVSASATIPRASTVSLTAAILQARTATSSASAAILQARGAAASLSSAVRINRTVTTGIDSALLRAVTVQAGLSAALRQLRTVTTGADAAIKRALTASASLDSAIKAARAATAGMDGYVLGGNMAVASLAAAIKSSRSALASVDAAIKTARITSAGLSAGVLERKSAVVTLNAYIFAGKMAVASLNAAILERKTYTTALNAYVLAGTLLSVPRQMYSNSQASRRSNTQTARRP